MPPSRNVPPDYFIFSAPTLSFPPSCAGFERPDSEILRHAPLSGLGPASVIPRPDPNLVLQDPSSRLEPAPATTLQPDPDLLLQDIDAKLMFILRTRFDANWEEWQDLLGQKQDAPAWRSADMSSMCKTANLLPNEDEAWTIAPHTLAHPQHILSSLMTSAQPKTQSCPTYTIYNREGNKIFHCQCGHETLRKGDMTRHHQSLVHASKSQTCSCGKRYTRKDSLRRHKMACIYPLLHNCGSPS